MRSLLPGIALSLAVCAVVAAPLFAAKEKPLAPMTAGEIMARVAENQDRTEAARTHYIYLQHVRAVSRKTGGKVMCEEITDSRVSPRAKGSHQDLLTLNGRAWQKSGYVTYHALQQDAPEKDKATEAGQQELDGMDVDLVENLRKNLTDDERGGDGHQGVHLSSGGEDRPAGQGGADIWESKDGLEKGLFPLTSKQQQQYLFELAGRQTMNGRDVYRIRFRPKDKNDFNWKGEAFIDAHAFEPVVVYTEMSRKIPLAVRTLLGTNLPGLGFSVTYAPQPDGVWFPVGFGTEFRMRVLFFIARDISISLSNTHFEKTHTDVKLLDGVKVVKNAAPVAPTPSHP